MQLVLSRYLQHSLKLRSLYFLLRTNKELAMKSRRGKARRISAASFPGCEFFLTTSVPPFDSSISTFLLLGGSPETQVWTSHVLGMKRLSPINKQTFTLKTFKYSECSSVLQNKLLVTTTLRYCFTYTTRNMWKGRVPPIRPFPLMCKDDMNRGALTTTYCRASSTTRRRRKNRDPGDPAMALHECPQGLRIENFQSMFVF